jgi:phage terminase large subunit
LSALKAETLGIDTAEVFEPLLGPCRYKGAYGGRGSGKSHFFAEALVEQALMQPGFRAVCIREVQKSLKDSAKKLIEDKIADMGVGAKFDIQTAEIKTPGGGSILFQGMQDHTAESIKSLEGMNVAWVEEAQTLSEKSWRMLRPTIRSPGSEIWASWNPRLRSDPVDLFFRGPLAKGDDKISVVRANWSDNPWFPETLKDERERDLKNEPDAYPNTWDGDYVTILKGSYYAGPLKECDKDERITFVAKDPNLRIYAFWDIGGPGKKADAMTVVIAQFVGQRINVLDYIEGQGQVLGYYTQELNDRGWGKAYCVVPHDAAQTHADNPTGMDFEAQLQQAGFQTEKVHSPPGIVMQRIATSRKWFPRIWFNKAKTEALRAALGWYHEKRDEDRDVGLGPDHDWSSHGADAFGLMCIFYTEPQKAIEINMPNYGAY